MAKKRPARLTHSFVNSLALPGRYGDGRGGFGLSLLVKRTKNGRWSKTWSQRLRINGVLITRGLGSFPLVSLAMARDKAFENAQQAEQGEDIRKPPPVVPTVWEAFDLVVALRSPGWKNPRTGDWWRLSKQYCESIGNIPVSEVTPSDVREIIGPLWHQQGKTAREVRSTLSAVMSWAVDEGHLRVNPARAEVTRHLGRAQVPKHHRSLDSKDLGAALVVVRDADIWWAVKWCLIFIALTCVRSGEAREATWDEVDLDKAVWKIPAARMKRPEEHKVPLSAQAVEVLCYARSQGVDRSGLVFPSERPGECVREYRLSKLFRDLGIPAVPHGLRATFRNWAGGTAGIADPVAETVLAHVQKEAVRRAYLTSDFFEYRVPVMQEWADFIAETMGPVVPT